MRLQCQVLSQRGTVIPPNSRSPILSLIKEAIQQSGPDGMDFYQRWYHDNTTKPFTFAPYFPLARRGEESVLDGDFFQFLFSTTDYEFLMRLYNGLLAIPESFRLFGQPFRLKKCHLLPNRSIPEGRVTFKTLSPLLVRDPKNGDTYLYPEDGSLKVKGKDPDQWKYWRAVDDSTLREALHISLRNLAGTDTLTIREYRFQIVPIRHGSHNPDHPYTMTLPGLKGTITLEASSQVLQYLYDVGIGARSSEGFGMLEVVE